MEAKSDTGQRNHKYGFETSLTVEQDLFTVSFAKVISEAVKSECKHNYIIGKFIKFIRKIAVETDRQFSRRTANNKQNR